MNDSTKVLIGAAGGAILALLLFGLLRGATGYGAMGGGMMGGGMMGGGLFGALFALLIWLTIAAVLVAALVYVITTLRHR